MRIRSGTGISVALLAGPSSTMSTRSTSELELKPGSYEAICTIPGHKEAGMAVTVEVTS